MAHMPSGVVWCEGIGVIVAGDGCWIVRGINLCPSADVP
jgi:hypothetical protein